MPGPKPFGACPVLAPHAAGDGARGPGDVKRVVCDLRGLHQFGAVAIEMMLPPRSP
jgi:hypothetical protein